MSNVILFQPGLISRIPRSSTISRPGENRKDLKPEVPPYFRTQVIQYFLRGMVHNLSSSLSSNNTSFVDTRQILWQQLSKEGRQKLLDRKIRGTREFTWNFWDLN